MRPWSIDVQTTPSLPSAHFRPPSTSPWCTASHVQHENFTQTNVARRKQMELGVSRKSRIYSLKWMTQIEDSCKKHCGAGDMKSHHDRAMYWHTIRPPHNGSPGRLTNGSFIAGSYPCAPCQPWQVGHALRCWVCSANVDVTTWHGYGALGVQVAACIVLHGESLYCAAWMFAL